MKKKPGRWMGIIAFIHVILSISGSQIILVFSYDINVSELYKISALSFGVFSVVWGCVFGSGAIKNWKGVQNDKIS